MTVQESDLLEALLLRVPHRLPHVRIFRRNVAMVRRGSYRFRVGITGQCDTYAIVRGGLHLELELKTATGIVSPEQEEWLAWCRAWNVPHAVLRGRRGETPAETADRWCDEIEAMIAGSSPGGGG